MPLSSDVLFESREYRSGGTIQRTGAENVYTLLDWILQLVG